MGQDTVLAGTFWGVLNVLLHASGAQFGWDILTGAPTGNVLIQTDTFSSLTGVSNDLLDVEIFKLRFDHKANFFFQT